MKILIPVMLILAVACYTTAQKAESSPIVTPKIGEICPDYTFREVSQFKKSKVSIKDFRGKWLFLNFWSFGCEGSVNKIEQFNDFFLEFGTRANFLLIGKTSNRYGWDVKNIYRNLNERKKLKVPYAFADDEMLTAWDVSTYPHVIIVDPNGRIIHITNWVELTFSRVADILAGKAVTLPPKGMERPKFDPDHLSVKSPALVTRSVLTEWRGEHGAGYWLLDDWLHAKGEEGLRSWTVGTAPLTYLYNLAFIGARGWSPSDSLYYSLYSPVPVLEVADPSPFDSKFSLIPGQARGIYNYQLFVPPGQDDKGKIMMFMQEDLHRAFGYQARLEKRSKPVWLLTASTAGADKLKSKSGPSHAKFTPVSLDIQNKPMAVFIRAISWRVFEKTKIPIFDATGIQDKIDIQLEADFSSIEDMKRELRKQGLDLIEGHREMFVVVISDPTE